MTDMTIPDLPAFLDRRNESPAQTKARKELAAKMAALRPTPQPTMTQEPNVISIKTNSDATKKLPVPPPKAAQSVVASAPVKASKPAIKPAPKPKAKSDGKPRHNIGTVASAAILDGADNEQALAKVMKAFPDCSSNLGCMSWYRNKLRRSGQLKVTKSETSAANKPAPKAAPAKTKAQAKKSRPTKAKK